MTGIKVTPDQLIAQGSSVKKSAGDIEGVNKAMTSQLQALVGGDWAGGASGAFNELYAKFQSSSQQLNEALVGIANLLTNAGHAYANREQEITRSFTVS